MKFQTAPKTGRPVDPPAGTALAHQYRLPDGSIVVVRRDAGGRFVRGSGAQALARGGPVGAEARNPESVARAALGLQSRWTEAARRRKDDAKP